MKVVSQDGPKPTVTSVSKDDVVELRIALKNCQPTVERTLTVRADITFGELHHFIQAVMGWENTHLHEFKVGKKRVGMEPEDDFFADEEMLVEDEVRLFELLAECKGKFVYWYDFGDDWMHDIKAKVLPPAKAQGLELPCCTAGSGACPPEDCGGPWGYAEMLETLRSGSSQRKKEIRSWLGGSIDPEVFDLKAADKALQPFRS